MTISYEGLNLDSSLPDPDDETDPARLRKLELAARIRAVNEAIVRPIKHVKINQPPEPDQPAAMDFRGHTLAIPEEAVIEGGLPCKPPLRTLLKIEPIQH